MKKKHVDVYEIVNDKIISLLESGTVPWQKPWKTPEPPTNLISKKQYRGINTMLLGCTPYPRQYWLTFNQCNGLGGKVRKGEKSTIVVFWKFLDVADKDNPEKITTIPLLRYYRVFNIDQCEEIPETKIPAKAQVATNTLTPIDRCEKTVNDYADKPAIVFKTQQAYYNPANDYVNMPARDSFVGIEEYYSTLFHELVHSTGHETRLNRLTEKAAFGSQSYSKEELVAEYGAAYLCGLMGIENKTIDNSAAYINSWLSKLKSDKRLLVTACGAAQKAVDYITNHKESE